MPCFLHPSPSQTDVGLFLALPCRIPNKYSEPLHIDGKDSIWHSLCPWQGWGQICLGDTGSSGCSTQLELSCPASDSRSLRQPLPNSGDTSSSRTLRTAWCPGQLFARCCLGLPSAKPAGCNFPAALGRGRLVSPSHVTCAPISSMQPTDVLPSKEMGTPSTAGLPCAEEAAL